MCFCSYVMYSLRSHLLRPTVCASEAEGSEPVIGVLIFFAMNIQWGVRTVLWSGACAPRCAARLHVRAQKADVSISKPVWPSIWSFCICSNKMTAPAANFKAADQNPAITRRVSGLHTHRLKSQYHHCVMVLIVESVVYMSDVCKWQHETLRKNIQFFNSNPCIMFVSRICSDSLFLFSWSC